MNQEINELFPVEKNVPEAFAFSETIEQTEYLVNGEIKQWTKNFQDVYSPICFSHGTSVKPVRLGKYPLLDEAETMLALKSATDCYDNGRGAWPTMKVKDRVKCMDLFVSRMKLKRNEVVKLLMWEIGKSLEDCEKEFDRTVDYINDTCEELKKLDRESSRFTIQQGIIAQIRRGPLGVVLCMGPFNYPLNETFATLIPALIMGNAVIMKPPKKGVLLYRPLLSAFRDCFPNGAINFVYGEGKVTSGSLMKSGKIDVLAFIGSSNVATELKKLHPAPHKLRSALGLESKNPAIILPDSDLELTVKESVLGTLSFNGQRCTALKLLFVHSKIESEFLILFTNAIEKVNYGMPWEKGVLVTPLPDEG